MEEWTVEIHCMVAGEKAACLCFVEVDLYAEEPSSGLSFSAFGPGGFRVKTGLCGPYWTRTRLGKRLRVAYWSCLSYSVCVSSLN